MKVTIIGAGNIGQVYGRLWREAGHTVVLTARDDAKVARIATDIGVEHAHGLSALKGADAVLLAVNYMGVDDAIERFGRALDGLLLIDATNPLGDGGEGDPVRLIGEDELAAEVMARKLPNARIAKAFSTLWFKHVETRADRTSPTLAMPFVVQQEDDRSIVETLISDAGFIPLCLGDLSRSEPLDPGSTIWNELLTSREMTEVLGAKT